MKKGNKTITIELSCDSYGWTPEKLNFNPIMIGHLKHHINNPLCIISFAAAKLLKEDPYNDEAAQIIDQVQRISSYLNALQKKDE